jgi:hypothetical protein
MNKLTAKQARALADRILAARLKEQDELVRANEEARRNAPAAELTVDEILASWRKLGK